MKTKQTMVGLMLAASVVVAAGWSVGQSSSADRSAEVRAWEHLALVHPSGDRSKDEALAAQIRSLGNKGWELVSVANFSESGNTVKTGYYFKRPR